MHCWLLCLLPHSCMCMRGKRVGQSSTQWVEAEVSVDGKRVEVTHTLSWRQGEETDERWVKALLLPK